MVVRGVQYRSSVKGSKSMKGLHKTLSPELATSLFWSRGGVGGGAGRGGVILRIWGALAPHRIRQVSSVCTRRPAHKNPAGTGGVVP
jgi:hypothetical protein